MSLAIETVALAEHLQPKLQELLEFVKELRAGGFTTQGSGTIVITISLRSHSRAVEIGPKPESYWQRMLEREYARVMEAYICQYKCGQASV